MRDTISLFVCVCIDLEATVSTLHKALRSAETSSVGAQLQFNPLSRPAAQPTGWWWYATALGLLALTVALLLWPTSKTVTVEIGDSNNASVERPSVLPPAVPISSAKENLSAIAQPLVMQRAVEQSAQLMPITKPTAMAEVDSNAAQKPQPEQPPQPEQKAHSKPQSTAQPVKTKPNTQPTFTATNEVTAAENPKAVTSSALTQESTAAATPIVGIRQAINQWQQQVEGYLAAGEDERAEAVLKTWITAQPKNPQPRIWLARIYIHNGVYRSAEPLLRGLNSNDARALLGVIYERTNRPQVAMQTFEALYRAQPDNSRWLLFWAINSENAGQLANANALYQTYLQQFSADDPQLTSFAQQRLRSIRGQ